MSGFVHSIESFGTVDGPGIRMVIFMQGCPLRCSYCHNPDTWEIGKGTKTEADDIIKEYLKNEAFYRKGGITVTGGEPLLQIDFLLELFEKAKKEGIHTCIDTSGITYNRKNREYIKKLDRLFELCDLVMLDIKHIDAIEHKKLTGADNENILEFARYLDEKNVSLWIRHVVVYGITDNRVYLKRLGQFLATLGNVKALDVLPYHTMGVAKYKELGIEYKLEGVSPLDNKDAKEARNVILDAMKKERQRQKAVKEET